MYSAFGVGSPVSRVKNIDKVLTFYEKDLSWNVTKKYYNDDRTLIYELSFQHPPSLLKNRHILKSDPNAMIASHCSAGLYHFWILVPDRKSLA